MNHSDRNETGGSVSATEALHASAASEAVRLEARFRALVEQLPGGVYIEELDASSASYISPWIEQLTGYSAAEWTADADFFTTVLHPDDRDRVVAAFADAHQTFRPVQIEYRVVAKDGRIVWIQDDAAVACDAQGRPLYLQGFMADVTARKENELALREMQDRYRDFAEQLPFVTYVDDLSGSADYLSPQVEQLLGYTAEECAAAEGGFASFVHPDDRDASAEEIGRAREQARAYEVAYRMVAADGSEIWVRDIAVPIRNESGRIRYWQGYRVDITERRAMSDERDQLLDRERAQNERLRSLDRLKDEFVALVSHELRTPLTSIRGYIELILDGAEELPSETRGFLEIVDRNSGRLIHLVGDLLLMAQAEGGMLSFDWTTVELQPVVARCVEAAEPAAEQGGVELQFDCHAETSITSDSIRLAQLLDNLISNAIKFTPRGGRVDVRVASTGASVVIEVSDTGFGISAEDQAQLFDRFFRTRSATEKAISGTGLGLSIAKAIVDSHGGSIGVDSAENRGTTFRIELPVDRDRPALDGGPDGDGGELEPLQLGVAAVGAASYRLV